MNENLRLRWQIAELKSQIELGRLEQDLDRDTEEGGLVIVMVGCLAVDLDVREVDFAFAQVQETAFLTD
jgi:hypothetical protein